MVFRSIGFEDQLEVSAILRFENILDYQKIYAIICDYLFIAGTRN